MALGIIVKYPIILIKLTVTYQCVCSYPIFYAHTHIYIYGTGLQPSSPPRWWWFLGLGALYLPGIQLSCKVSLLPRPPLWGGLGAVCMYLRRLVGIGMYLCVYVCMSCHVMSCHVMSCHVMSCMYVFMLPRPPLVGWVGCSMYVPT